MTNEQLIKRHGMIMQGKMLQAGSREYNVKDVFDYDRIAVIYWPWTAVVIGIAEKSIEKYRKN